MNKQFCVCYASEHARGLKWSESCLHQLFVFKIFLTASKTMFESILNVEK